MKNTLPKRCHLMAGPMVRVGFLLLCGFAALGAQEPPAAGSQQIDLETWVKEFSVLGVTSFKNNELFMRAKDPRGFYYVLVAPEEYTSAGHIVRVQLRNVKGVPTKLGYGLVFHSDPTPLEQGYAFVIDTVLRRYRIVRHESQDEETVIPWSKSPHINPGTQKNVLEVKDKGSSVELLINGKFVISVATPFAFKNGSPGLYTEAANIAFRDLTLTPVSPK